MRLSVFVAALSWASAFGILWIYILNEEYHTGATVNWLIGLSILAVLVSYISYYTRTLECNGAD